METLFTLLLWQGSLTFPTDICPSPAGIGLALAALFLLAGLCEALAAPVLRRPGR